MRVECYRNLHTGKISVRVAHGRVIRQDIAVAIIQPSFVVQPAGRQRVVQEQVKNVHAFVRGDECDLRHLSNFVGWESWNKATYNPYKAAWFYDKDSGSPLYVADFSVVTPSAVFYV